MGHIVLAVCRLLSACKDRKWYNNNNNNCLFYLLSLFKKWKDFPFKSFGINPFVEKIKTYFIKGKKCLLYRVIGRKRKEAL